MTVRLLPTPISDTAGLRVAADPRGYVVFEAPPAGAHLTPEDSLGIALDLIRLHAPWMMAAIEHAVRRQSLRVVQGTGGDAA